MKYIIITLLAIIVVGCGQQQEHYVATQTVKPSNQNHDYDHIMTIPVDRMKLNVYHFHHLNNDCYIVESQNSSRNLQPTISCTR
jgi:PBP1b-binding outer membrane lipoprotein LpoB